MPPRLFTRHFVASLALAVLAATGCLSTSEAGAATRGTLRATVNQGLCKLVPPAEVATAVNTSMNYPATVIRGSSTLCEYRSKFGTATTVLLRYDTHANEKTFANSKKAFERSGLKLPPIQGLGDEAYYFSLSAGHGTTVTTVVVIQGSIQILTTGTGTIDHIGAIARYALGQYEGTHPH